MSPQGHSRQERRAAASGPERTSATGAGATLLDSYREVVTPEGVALHLPAAGPVPRALAWLIDLLARTLVLATVSVLLALLGDFGKGLYLLVTFLVFWAYPILFEVLWQGQTPGKRVLCLRVLAGDGAPVGWLAAIVRNLLRTVDMLPVGYAAGLLSCLFDRHSRRLGDLVADTVVVHAPARVGQAQVPQVPPLAAGQPLQAADQAAIVGFAERSIRLAPARQAELADLLRPLTGSAGRDGVQRLFGIANALLGRR